MVDPDNGKRSNIDLHGGPKIAEWHVGPKIAEWHGIPEIAEKCWIQDGISLSEQ